MIAMWGDRSEISD